MSQVKNLRAMFEQRGDSSPPERGREGTPGQADSPRPLSRVRTNFVTVEKDGRVGLQRDTSSDSIPTLSRTMSAGTEGDVPTPTTSQTGVPDVKSSPEDARPIFVAQTPKRKPSAIPEETTPSPVKAGTPLISISKPVLGATPKVLAPVTDAKPSAPTPVASSKLQDHKENKENKPAAAPAEKSPVRKLFAKPLSKPIETGKTTSDAPKKSPDALGGGVSRLRMANPHSSAANGASKDKTAAPAAATSSLPMRSKIPSTVSAPKEATKAAPKTTTKTLPKAISTAKATAKTVTTKSTGLKVKTPTSPQKPLTPRLAASKPADKKAPAATVAEKKSTPATAAPKGAAGKKPPSIQTFPSNGIGFVKPKPKSPTRPVQLPSSLTTHTASSATKTRQSLSRQSGNFLAVHGASQASATRSLSRASVATVGGTASSTTKHKGLRRQSSTIGPQRPSIGPPPKQPARDHPIIKKEKVVDEGFLERMMRPTQSFASKTADKVHQSPPRSNRSRESFGSARSTTSSTRPSKERAISVPRSVPDETVVAPLSPVIVEPVEEIAVAVLPADEPEVVEDVKEVEEVVEPVEIAVAEAAPEEPESVEEPEVAEAEVEIEPEVESEAEIETEVVEETTEDAPDATSENVSEEIIEATTEEPAEEPAEETVEETAEETVKEPAEEVTEEVTEEVPEEAAEVATEESAVEESAPVTEATAEETTEDVVEAADVPEVSAAAEPKDVTHIDVAEVEFSDVVAEDKAAATETPAATTEL